MIDIRSRGQEVGSNVLQWLRCDDENITAVTTDEVRNTDAEFVVAHPQGALAVVLAALSAVIDGRFRRIVVVEARNEGLSVAVIDEKQMAHGPFVVRLSTVGVAFVVLGRDDVHQVTLGFTFSREEGVHATHAIPAFL